MNWLLVVVLFILLAGLIRGARKGLVRIIFSLVGMIVVVGFAIIATPHISAFLTEHTNIPETVEEKCEQKIRERTTEKIGESGGSLETLLEEAGIALPGDLAAGLGGAVGETVADAMDEAGIYAQASAAIAKVVINGISFVAALIVGIIVVTIIRKLLELVMDLPGLKTVNRFLGAAAGTVQGLVVVWIFLYVAGIFSGFDTAGGVMPMIEESRLLTWLYENNLLITILGGLL